MLTTIKYIIFTIMKKLLFILLFFLLKTTIFSQQIFYQDLCNCGVTGAGFSTSLGSGSGNFDIYIEPGSTIKKAYLFAQRFGEADSVSITINGIAYNFNKNNQISTNYYLHSVGNSALHAIDFTNNINPTTTNYSITIPTQSNVTIPPNPLIADANIKYGTVYLWVKYEKPTLQLSNSVILLNNYSFENNSITNYQVKNLTPIDTSSPVGFATYTDRLGDTLNQLDGSYIYI